MDTETNPAEPEVEDLPVIDSEEDGSTEATEDGNPDGEPEEVVEETIEIERDGKTYKVPVALKDDLLRQDDYTRKTQALSEQRKELEAAKERVQQAGEAEVNAKARAVAIEAAIKQYEGVDWNTLEQQDPAAAFSHWRKFNQLQTALGEANNEYQSAVQARTLETQQEAAKRIEQGLAELQRDIPDWGPQKAEELLSFGEKQFGMTRAYMESVDDPNLIKVMNFAYLAAKSQPKTTAPQAAPLKPAAKVKGDASPPRGLDDRMNAEEWVKARNRQLANR